MKNGGEKDRKAGGQSLDRIIFIGDLSRHVSVSQATSPSEISCRSQEHPCNFCSFFRFLTESFLIHAGVHQKRAHQQFVT